MALDGKILRAALKTLHDNKAQREAETDRRRGAVYAKLPRIREIDDELRQTMADTIVRALNKGGDPVADMEEIQNRNMGLQLERGEVLKSSGYPADFIDDKPNCEECDDTGFSKGKRCSCLMDIYKRLQNKELSSLIKLGEDTFETFLLNFYDNTVVIPEMGVTARENMSFNYDVCYNYAYNFGNKSGNLFLIGGTGLGKTFLSTCIAKVVSEKGYSVVYDTAVNIFNKFEYEKFNRSYDEDVSRETDRYLKCDLLIIDDLGTEMITSFVLSALYNLINVRLLNKRKTIISSNLSQDKLSDRYSEQIMSRLLGEYITLSFYGRDIRRIKSEM